MYIYLYFHTINGYTFFQNQLVLFIILRNTVQYSVLVMNVTFLWCKLDRNNEKIKNFNLPFSKI